ncbi:MAG: hypothetical protein QM765_05375 [Myxococcales bacterium]
MAKTCPSCRKPVEPAAEFCPDCLASLVPASEPIAAPAATPTSAPTPTAAPLPPESGPACAAHPDAAASETCGRCGTFVCSRCLEDAVDDAEKGLCPKCRDTREQWGAPADEKLLARDLAVGMLVFLGVFWGSSIPDVLAKETLAEIQREVVAGAILSAPVALCALLAWTARSRLAAWSGALSEILLAFAMLATRNFVTGSIALVLGGVAILQARKLGRIKASLRLTPR